MQPPVFQGNNYLLRPWDAADAGSLVRHANNPRVAGNLRDGFPHPYTLSDAKSWLASISGEKHGVILAVEVNGEAAGGIGLFPQKDVYRYNGEIGYWLSEYHWGKGIMTEALGAVVEFAFTETELLRLFAGVFENNPSSMRVLEKNGFTRECIHRKSVMKAGKRLDEHVFALLREDWQEMQSRQAGSASSSSASPSSPSSSS